jgi:hypothetical protein
VGVGGWVWVGRQSTVYSLMLVLTPTSSLNRSLPHAHPHAYTRAHKPTHTVGWQVFGGYLLRMAYESAWTTVVDLLDDSRCGQVFTDQSDTTLYSTTGTAVHMAAVKLARVSEVHFLLPVEVGNLLEITSRPVFTAEDGAVIVVTECKASLIRYTRAHSLTHTLTHSLTHTHTNTNKDIHTHTHINIIRFY